MPYALDPEDATGGIARAPAGGRSPATCSTGFPFFGGVFALMLGVFALGSEYGWDTLKTLFTQRPGRLRVFAAKLAALAIVLVPVRARCLRRRRGRELRDRADRGRGWRRCRRCGCCCARSPPAGSILAAWAALGVLLGVLSRGTSLAIGIGILYALVIEGLLSAFADR